MSTVQMNASAIGGLLPNLPFSGSVAVPANGIITVDSRDAIDLLRLGAQYVSSLPQWNYIGVPLAATAGRIVASTALANGTLAIAHQPDLPRQVGVRVDPGTSAVTAGNIALSYTANDGTAQVDNISAVTAASTVFTLNSSKGVVHLTSAIITGIAGGATPLVQVNDTNSISLLVGAGFTAFTILKENVDNADEAIGTVTSTAASVTPTTAPNGTHAFAFGYVATVANA